MCCPVLCCPVLSWPVLSCPVLCWPVLYCLSCLSYQLILCSSLSSFQNWEFDLSNSIFRSFLSLKKIGRYRIDPVNLYKRSKGAIRSFSQSGRFFDKKNDRFDLKTDDRIPNPAYCFSFLFSLLFFTLPLLSVFPIPSYTSAFFSFLPVFPSFLSVLTSFLPFCSLPVILF